MLFYYESRRKSALLIDLNYGNLMSSSFDTVAVFAAFGGCVCMASVWEEEWSEESLK